MKRTFAALVLLVFACLLTVSLAEEPAPENGYFYLLRYEADNPTSETGRVLRTFTLRNAPGQFFSPEQYLIHLFETLPEVVQNDTNIQVIEFVEFDTPFEEADPPLFFVTLPDGTSLQLTATQHTLYEITGQIPMSAEGIFIALRPDGSAVSLSETDYQTFLETGDLSAFTPKPQNTLITILDADLSMGDGGVIVMESDVPMGAE